MGRQCNGRRLVSAWSVAFVLVIVLWGVEGSSGPTVIRDVRVQDLSTTPFLGRGYSIATNTFQSACIGDLVVTEPSYNFTYDFEQIESSSNMSKKLSSKSSGSAYSFVAGIVAKSKQSNSRDSTKKSTRESKFLSANLRVFTFYASINEALSKLSSKAANLLRKNDLPGFFASCGPYAIRGITRDSEFMSVFTWTKTTSDTTSVTTKSDDFGDKLMDQLKSYQTDQSDLVAAYRLGVVAMSAKAIYYRDENCSGDLFKEISETVRRGCDMRYQNDTHVFRQVGSVLVAPGVHLKVFRNCNNTNSSLAGDFDNRRGSRPRCFPGMPPDYAGYAEVTGSIIRSASSQGAAAKSFERGLIPKKSTNERGLSDVASDMELNIRSRGWGMGKREGAMLITTDIKSFKQSIKDAFQTMLNPLTGRVHSMEVVPWVENSEFQELVKLQGRDVIAGKEVPLYKKKDILSQNAEFLQEVWAAARAKLNVYYKASLCAKFIRARWYAGDNLDPQYANDALVNLRTGSKDERPAVTIGTLAAKLEGKDNIIDSYLNEYQQFMYEDADANATICVDKLVSDPSKRGEQMSGAINAMAKGGGAVVQSVVGIGASAAAESVQLQGRGLYLVRYSEHAECVALRERFVNQSVLDSVVDDHCMPRTVYEPAGYNGIPD